MKIYIFWCFYYLIYFILRKNYILNEIFYLKKYEKEKQKKKNKNKFLFK